MARARSDLLQITLFKDHDTARSLQVPIAWIRRVATLGLLLLISVILISLIALREFRAARRFDPSRVVDLEQQVAELREAQELKLQTPTTPTVTEKSPEPTMGPVPLQDLPPFSVEEPELNWKDNFLKVTLRLKYTRGDSKSQAGTLVFVAQTSSGLLTYPENLLSTTSDGTPALAIEKGERFNVSKLRETTAQFSTIGKSNELKNLTLYLFGPDRKLLQKERLDVAAPSR